MLCMMPMHNTSSTMFDCRSQGDHCLFPVVIKLLETDPVWPSSSTSFSFTSYFSSSSLFLMLLSHVICCVGLFQRSQCAPVVLLLTWWPLHGSHLLQGHAMLPAGSSFPSVLATFCNLATLSGPHSYIVPRACRPNTP